MHTLKEYQKKKDFQSTPRLRIKRQKKKRFVQIWKMTS
jgi:hypothetical protein